MSAHEQLIAYLATLAGLIFVFLGALLIVAFVPSLAGKITEFGLGAITGGLIGILRIPSVRSPTASTETGDVTVNKEPSA